MGVALLPMAVKFFSRLLTLRQLAETLAVGDLLSVAH